MVFVTLSGSTIEPVRKASGPPLFALILSTLLLVILLVRIKGFHTSCAIQIKMGPSS